PEIECQSLCSSGKGGVGLGFLFAQQSGAVGDKPTIKPTLKRDTDFFANSVEKCRKSHLYDRFRQSTARCCRPPLNHRFSTFTTECPIKTSLLKICSENSLFSLINHCIASHLSKSTQNFDQNISNTQHKTGLQNTILDEEENLEVALKKFIEAWDRSHGTTHTNTNTHHDIDRYHRNHHNNSITNNELIITSQHLAANNSTSTPEQRLSSQTGDNQLQSDSPDSDSPFMPPIWSRSLRNSAQTSHTSDTSLSSNAHKSSNEEDEQLEDLTVDEEFSSHNCTRCVLHEEAKSRRLETIKVNILNKLGLKVAPNITGKSLPRIPPLHHLLDRYNMLGDDPRVSGPQLLNSFIEDNDHTIDKEEEDLEEFFVNAERSISFAQKPPNTLNIPPEVKCQYFKFPSNVLNSHVTKAHLWVFVKPTNHLQDTNAWIVIYQIVKPETGNDSPTLLHVRAKKIDVSSKKGVWVQIELKKLVSQWFRHPNENLGLAIHSYDKDGKELAVIEVNTNEDNSLLPFIEVKVESKAANRKRRMVGLNCEENSNEVRCCRYPLTVDFEEFGWDWIIAPKRYEANYCSGECPYVFLQKYPHTHLVQQANPSGSAGPCCSPRKMSAISMLYFDDNYNIIYGMLPGMVVDRCGCS
ncbi:unnamed protein product, partial [Oppiella nova]